MKTFIHAVGLCIICITMFNTQSVAQAQEGNLPNTNGQDLNSMDDLTPYPFDDKVPVKKTFGEKVKESIIGEPNPSDSLANAEQPVQHIRFYEFKDITFENDAIEPESNDGEIGPMEEYKLVEDDNIYRMEYYRDVTFENEKKEQEAIIYDDAFYSPYQERQSKPADNGDNELNVDHENDKQLNKSISISNPVAKPIEIKNRDFYRKDYIYYYYNRKKKAGSDISSFTDYSSAVQHCRYLFEIDQKAVRSVYETQLLEASEDFGRRMVNAANDEEKNTLKNALEKTTSIIRRVFEEEEKNLQNAFDKAVEELGNKFNGQKRHGNYTDRRIKRGD